MSYLKSRWFGLLAIGLLVQTLLAGAWSPALAEAAPPPFYQSTITKAEVDQADHSLWMLWSDNFANQNKKSYLSHYSPDGQLLNKLDVSWKHVSDQVLGFIFEPGAPRLYYAFFEVVGPNIAGIAYLDLKTGKEVTLSGPSSYPKCSAERLVFNPELKHLYVSCNQLSFVGGKPAGAIVLDWAGDKVTGTLDYAPLGYNPQNSKVYAIKAHADSPGFDYPLFDLITLDAKTDQPTSDAPLFTDYGPAATIRSFHVNTKTGDVYVIRSLCYAKCTPPSQLVYNKNGQIPVDTNRNLSPVEVYNVINEATNQLYGPRIYNINRENIAISGANPGGDQLAGFYWTPLAVDQTRNLLYAVDNRDRTIPTPEADRGLGILVMDGANYDIVRFIAVRTPDDLYTKNAQRLSGPPANFDGWFFPETGHTLSGKFLEYWNTRGGLAIYGYPITEVFDEYNPDDGKVHQVQYFERNRFELHPENAGTQFEVQLGLLGRSFAAQTGPAVTGRYNSGETEPINGGLLFKETNHTLTGKFLEYWNQYGGLSVFGLPVTEPFQEVSPIDGKTYTVQYFERNRFEYHPEHAGTRFEVELGLLGTQVLRSRAWPV